MSGSGSGSGRGGENERTRPTIEHDRTYTAAAAGRNKKKHDGNGHNYGRFLQLVEQKEYAAAWHLAMEVSHKRIQQIVEQTTNEVMKKTTANASRSTARAGAISIPSRHTAEIIVRPKELEQREPPEIVKAVPSTSVIAATKRKEDIVLRCSSTEGRDELIKNTQWATAAFGHGVEIRTRQLQLFARIPQEDIAAKREDWSATNGTGRLNIKPQYRNGGLKGVVVGVGFVEDANKLCDHGIVVNGKVHKTEPFCGDGRPMLCFRCG